MRDLLSLLYISTATSPPTEETLAEILTISRSNNLKAGITGVLCSGGGHFIQVLEGPQKKVLESYLRILDDKRHQDCLLVGMVPLRKRNFENWTMGHINASEEKIQERRQLLISYWQKQAKSTELIHLMRQLLQLMRTSP